MASRKWDVLSIKASVIRSYRTDSPDRLDDKRRERVEQHGFLVVIASGNISHKTKGTTPVQSDLAEAEDQASEFSRAVCFFQTAS